MSKHMWIGIRIADNPPTKQELRTIIAGMSYTKLNEGYVAAEIWLGDGIPKKPLKNLGMRTLRETLRKTANEMERMSDGWKREIVPPHIWLDAYGGINEAEPKAYDEYQLMLDLISENVLVGFDSSDPDACHCFANALKNLDMVWERLEQSEADDSKH